MGMLRTILFVLVTFSASLIGTMSVDQMVFGEHDHMISATVVHEEPACCDSGTERGQSCHVLPAVLADADAVLSAPLKGGVILISGALLPTGIELSGPLDPPRHA